MFETLNAYHSWPERAELPLRYFVKEFGEMEAISRFEADGMDGLPRVAVLWIQQANFGLEYDFCKSKVEEMD